MTPFNILKDKPIYRLKEVGEPNLLLDIFDYDQVPKIVFDDRVLPPDPAEDIWITDTTFRDGQQARPPYTIEQIVHLFDLLHKLGGPNGIIRQSEFFLYSAKEKRTVEKCLERGYRYPEVTGWIRAVPKDLELVKKMGLKETGILTSASDYHIFLKLHWDRKKALDNYLGLVKTALSAGIVPRCHLEDITRADFHGFVLPFAQELMRLADESGVSIKIRACDTMGYGVTYPGAALPRSVPKLVYLLRHEGGVPSAQLEWHGHNDFHKVHVNAAAAWLYGAAAANGTLLGFGERTGNPPIEGLIMEYIGLKGAMDGIEPTVITDIAAYFRDKIKADIPTNFPFMGEDFNATRAGIHADGVIKNERIYNIFNTEKLLRRPIKVTITDKSGAAGIAYWVNTTMRLRGENKVDKRHPGVAKIYRRVQEEYETGRTTGFSSGEMRLLAERFLPELFESDFDRLKRKVAHIATLLAEQFVEDPDIQSMDPARQEPVMEHLIEEYPFMQFIYVVDLDGHKITKNITQKTERAAYKSFGKKRDFSDRDWFIQPLKTGKVYVTDFYTSKITNALCITVSAPLSNDRDEIVGIFGIDMKFEELVKIEDQFEDWLAQLEEKEEVGEPEEGADDNPSVDSIE
ncbi:MAG: histone-lysine N-methyltransferase [Candidatus Latescibacteria bacterium]|nr:histone-lysine N-methyltransferase [Candidatus Latescibacterota bacterium]